MDIQSTSTATLPTPTASAESRLIGDYNSFLLLLTTQLKNQDPLSPLDTTEFVSQLSQFAQVEQMIASNKRLEKIISALGASAALADIGLIGRTVEAASNAAELKDGAASLAYRLDKDAAQAAVAIRDAEGNLVRTLAVDPRAGGHTLTWDGTDDDGDQLDDGLYTFEFGAADGEGNPVATQAYVTATVQRVETAATGSTLVLSNGLRIPASAIRAVVQG
jgi:flagellar basal-body rod modification protein FlgD